MTTSIGSNPSSVQTMASLTTSVNPTFKEAWKDLAKSLKTGDLDAARQSYAAVLENAPEGMAINRGSPFAQLGKALITGDIDAAKSAFASMIRSKFEGRPITPPPTGGMTATTGAVVTSSTGGRAGTLLNVSA